MAISEKDDARDRAEIRMDVDRKYAPVAKPATPMEILLVRQAFARIHLQSLGEQYQQVINMMKNQLDLMMQKKLNSSIGNIVLWNKNGIILTPNFVLNKLVKSSLDLFVTHSPPQYKYPRFVRIVEVSDIGALNKEEYRHAERDTLSLNTNETWFDKMAKWQNVQEVPKRTKKQKKEETRMKSILSTDEYEDYLHQRDQGRGAYSDSD